ncbi:MAG TPA: hypothetical protein VK169_02075 [Saprospiraceae bacterium]|nr:hypothetical protein [Saprospiraceae bacterium]
MQEQVINALKKVSFLSRYSEICSEYSNFEQSKTPLLKSMKEILGQIDDNYKYIKIERLFLKEMVINHEIKMRIVFSCSGGIFEFRIIVIKDDEWVLNNRLDFLGNLINPDYKESLGDKCLPKTTNDEDTEQILRKVIALINEFKDEFQTALSKT